MSGHHVHELQASPGGAKHSIRAIYCPVQGNEKRKAKDFLGHKRYMTTAHGRALQQCEKLDAPLPAQPTPYTATGPLCEHKTLRILWRKEATSLYGLSLNSPVRETKHVRIMKRWADLRAALRTQNLNSRCRSRAGGGSRLLMRRRLSCALEPPGSSPGGAKYSIRAIYCPVQGNEKPAIWVRLNRTDQKPQSLNALA
jgi:hypothetical protein